LGHGDLVRSNILITNEHVVLVDWEHARGMPIAFDLAKLVLHARDPEEALTLIRKRHPGLSRSPRESYSLERQIALGLVQMLSWTAPRQTRAQAAGRLDLFEHDTRARVDLLHRLLGVEPAS
jgi:thiamine kinase-like enzyme